MESIKNLFKIKAPVDSQLKDEENETIKEQIRITYYQSGYGASVKASGNPVTFGVGLKNLYNSFENQCKKQIHEQERLKQPDRQEQEKVKTQLKQKETANHVLEEQIKNINNKIEQKKFERIDVKQNPETYGIDADKRPKAQFYIGLALLLPITIYLFVFYISASYSAFFKDFETGSLTSAIFDADALGKAIRDGWLEGVFVGTIPFVFMGLGYLVHMFQKSKGWQGSVKLGFLFLLTFVFDVILAYLIEKKIFLFDALVGQVFTPKDAVQSVNFWGIIFAGFVVYIIWGLVFDFVMKEHENVDKIKAFIRSKSQEIKVLQDNIGSVEQKVSQIKLDITTLQGRIAELQTRIDGFIFPVKEYLHYHYQYKEGWYQAINSELQFPIKQLNELRDACEIVEKEHLRNLNLDEINYQNLIFTSFSIIYSHSLL